MSVKYRNASGQESIIAGLTPGGDIEAGAVATRSGKVDVSPLEVGAYQVTNVTFDTPMPDDTYIINIDCTSGRLNIATFGKTANGFSIVYLNSSNLTQPQGDLIDWTATKTYTVQHDIQNTEAIANIEAAMPADAGLANKLATKSYVDNADSAIDSRLDNIEDAMPTTASVTNKLATKNDVDNVQIDALGDIADVEVTGVQSGQTILWDSDDSKWVAGQAGKVYTAGDGIEISTLDKISVDDEYVPLTFVGTKAQWDELTVSQKAKYTLVNITDDPATGGAVVVDRVAEGNMNPVTSNAVANYKNVTYKDFEVSTYTSVIGDWAPYKYYHSQYIGLSGYKPVSIQLVAPSGNHGFVWFNNVNDGSYMALCAAPTSEDPIILRVTYIMN